MNHPSFFVASTAETTAPLHDTGFSGAAGVGAPPKERRTESMSQDELEAHIKSCGYLMERAMRNWCLTGNFADRGEADRWRLLMEEAIRGRSAAQVARMERERGLA